MSPLRPAKHIALIGYNSDLFLSFGRALEQGGFRVYWVHSLRSFTRSLLRKRVASSQIVDLSDPRDFNHEIATAARELAVLERPGLPRINDIILMDRMLRTKPYDFALRYLAHAARALRRLVDTEDIACFASGRDTSLQLLSLLVARNAGIVWAGATYMRLPNERFMLCSSHNTDEVLPLGEVTDEHREAARDYLATFRTAALKPYACVSSTSWASVAARLPLHLRQGWRLLRESVHDRRNDFSRYTLFDIARIYLRKKVNLLQSQLFRGVHPGPGTRPYALFGLHRQPESSVDVLGAYFSDQLNFVRTIARSMPLGYDLLVKVHVSDADGWPLSFYRELAALPGVRLVEAAADARRLLLGAALTITNSGTMAYEAGLLGRPAITFSRLHFNTLPTVRYCDSPPALPAVIDEMLKRGARDTDDAQIEVFLARMFAWSFPALPNRSVFDSVLTANDLHHLVKAYDSLYWHCVRSFEARGSRGNVA